MGQIRVLPLELINQIAAGEVIERPSSVVKELVENAIDAGAAGISVEMQGTGLELIRVSDDGAGMAEHELELALQRHATSKIRTTEDLFAIRTLGFRGEALPSIASVSRTAISSRQHGSPFGHCLRMEALGIISRSKKGMPPGTIVEVSDLFFNTPARRKFLKTTATEQRNVIDVLNRYALAYPGIRFGLVVNNRQTMSLPAQPGPMERASSVLGNTKMNSLTPFRREFPGITVHGLAALPAEARQNRSGIYVFVNNRSVKDVLLGSAVMEGYSGLLMKGRYPVVVLFVELDPTEVDVNVHPAKAEVRFSHASAVFAMVAQTLKETLSPAGKPCTDPGSAGVMPRELLFRSSAPAPLEAQEKRSVAYGHRALQRMQSLSLFDGGSAHENWAMSYAGLNIIGTLHSTYILLSDETSLYILDQHAAHERITFERLMALHHSGTLSTQLLMDPLVMELSMQEFNAYEEAAQQITSIGIDCEPFGGTSIAIRAVPEALSASDIKVCIYGLIHSIMEGELHTSRPQADCFRDMIASIACHASVRSGKTLTLPEAAALLKDLDEAGSPTTCPHGRPLFKKIPQEEIERWMGRRT